VYIPSCDDHEGIYGRTVTLTWVCPVCGGPRGEPFDTISYDGSRRLHVHGWDNPCGHVDKYDAVRKEAGEVVRKLLISERDGLVIGSIDVDVPPAETPEPIDNKETHTMPDLTNCTTCGRLIDDAEGSLCDTCVDHAMDQYEQTIAEREIAALALPGGIDHSDYLVHMGLDEGATDDELAEEAYETALLNSYEPTPEQIKADEKRAEIYAEVALSAREHQINQQEQASLQSSEDEALPNPKQMVVVELPATVDMTGQEDVLATLQAQAAHAEQLDAPPLTTPSGVAEHMRQSKNADDWDKRLREVKHANGGDYPNFWFVTIMISGLAAEVSSRW